MPAFPTRFTTLSDRLAFLGRFIRQPLEVASIAPSSRFVARRVARCVRGASGTIVEIGSGTGGITRALLGTIAADARLVAVELNPALAERVARIDDPRLVVHCGSAEDLPVILRQHGCSPANAIVCGLPFSMVPRLRGMRILRALERSLAPGGDLVAYQIRDTLGRMIGSRLVAIEETIEWLGIPPLRISRWRRAHEARGRAAARESTADPTSASARTLRA
jgi:phosphatidylethanolamine/phosphatidyl-N-methylethanolamine N-methyltransferase